MKYLFIILLFIGSSAVAQYKPPYIPNGPDVSTRTTDTVVVQRQLTAGTAVRSSWTKINGPTGGAKIDSVNLLTGRFHSWTGTGVYTYRLTVWDSQNASDIEDVIFTVSSGAPPVTPNVPPIVNAGVDQTIQLPTSSVTLVSSATDSDGSIATYQWTRVSGPGAVIQSPTSPTTVVNGISTVGTYVFRVVATDNKGATASDDITVTVTQCPPTYKKIIVETTVEVYDSNGVLVKKDTSVKEIILP